MNKKGRKHEHKMKKQEEKKDHWNTNRVRRE